MDLTTVRYNASMIYDKPNAVFVADKNGKLNTIVLRAYLKFVIPSSFCD